MAQPVFARRAAGPPIEDRLLAESFRLNPTLPRGPTRPTFMSPREYIDAVGAAREAGAKVVLDALEALDQGPLTWATLRVLRALLWRFHRADGSGRCFPSYERIAAAAKCHRDSVCVAIAALEDAGLLTWVHRLTRIRHREQDLFGAWGSVWQVIRTSNAYQFLDPLR
jgi:hypothetical protein